MGACCTSAESGRQPLVSYRPQEKDPAYQKAQIESDLFNGFDKPYLFKKENIVIIKHHANGSDLQGKSLCVHEKDNKNKLYGDGDLDIFSKFEAFPETSSVNGETIKLKSLHNGKYIRIASIMANHATKNILDCNGDDDKFCVFKIKHLAQDGHVKLESVEC